MFNRKLKRKIAQLEIDLLDSKDSVKTLRLENSQLKWQIENPPKYRIGEKVNDIYTVVSFKYIKPDIIPLIVAAAVAFLNNTKSTDKYWLEYRKFIVGGYQYRLRRGNGNLIVTKMEDEL